MIHHRQPLPAAGLHPEDDYFLAASTSSSSASTMEFLSPSAAGAYPVGLSVGHYPQPYVSATFENFQSLRPENLGSRLNPFETARYNSRFAPDTRTLHTSLREKFRDTFEVWKGEGRSSFSRRAGLFDYLTLGIPQLIDVGAQFIGRKSRVNKAWFPIFIPLLALDLLLNQLVRPLFSFIATVATSPFVVIAHAVSSAVGYVRNRQLANQIDVVPPAVAARGPGDAPAHSTTRKLQTALSENKASLANCTVYKTSDNTLNVTSRGKSSVDEKFVASIQPNANQLRTLQKVNGAARQFTTREDCEPRFRRF